MTKAYEIKISGQVQAVGFRYNAQKKAHALGIAGTVQNAADGTVLIHGEGEEKNLEQFLQWCHDGPDGARVNKVESREVEAENLQAFEVIT